MRLTFKQFKSLIKEEFISTGETDADRIYDLLDAAVRSTQEAFRLMHFDHDLDRAIPFLVKARQRALSGRRALRHKK